MMLFVLSPTKTLTFGDGQDGTRGVSGKAYATYPPMLAEMQELLATVRALPEAKLRAMMSLSASLASLNRARYEAWQDVPVSADLESGTAAASKLIDGETMRCAVYAFDGPAFRGIDPFSLDDEAIAYLHEHLRILSGLYGFLRPLDAIQPYRLEMGSKVDVPATATKTLYAYWKHQHLTDKLLRPLAIKADSSSKPILVNVASNEYFNVIDQDSLPEGLQVVTCVFLDDGRIKSTFAKRARGLMVRYAAMTKASSVDHLRGFDLEGYKYSAAQSDGDTTLTFLRTKAAANKATEENRKRQQLLKRQSSQSTQSKKTEEEEEEEEATSSNAAKRGRRNSIATAGSKTGDHKTKHAKRSSKASTTPTPTQQSRRPSAPTTEQKQKRHEEQQQPPPRLSQHRMKTRARRARQSSLQSL